MVYSSNHLVFSGLNTSSHSLISQGGQNLLWMIVCYILGAFIRVTDIPGRAITWFILFFATLICSTILNHFFPILNRDYTALPFIGSCLCVFLALTRIQIRSKIILRFLSWAAPLSFGVYLFHNHPLLWATVSRVILRIAYAIDFSWPSWVIAPAVIYTLGTVSDWCRSLLFKKAKINHFSDKIAIFLTKAARKALRLN